VQLGWVEDGSGSDSISPVLEGRNLAISMYIPGSSGPMTYHGTALQESFLAAPNSAIMPKTTPTPRSRTRPRPGSSSTVVDVMAPTDTRVLVGAGSSVGRRLDHVAEPRTIAS